ASRESSAPKHASLLPTVAPYDSSGAPATDDSATRLVPQPEPAENRQNEGDVPIAGPEVRPHGLVGELGRDEVRDQPHDEDPDELDGDGDPGDAHRRAVATR